MAMMTCGSCGEATTKYPVLTDGIEHTSCCGRTVNAQRLNIIAPIGPSLPIGIHHKKHGAPVTGLSHDEQMWRQMQQVIPGDIPDQQRVPMGTAPTLEGLAAFIARVGEMNAIIDTQHLELATVGQELAQTGLSTISIMSSSKEDDDSREFDISEEGVNHNACRYGTAYTTQDLAPIVRRIEWERWVRGCSQLQRVFLTADNGKIGVSTNTVMIKDLAPFAPRLAAMLAGRNAEELENDIARAKHYGVGSGLYGVWTGEQFPEQSMDDLGAPEVNEQDGGPQELGLHNIADNGFVQYEPSEDELWPEAVMAVEE